MNINKLLNDPNADLYLDLAEVSIARKDATVKLTITETRLGDKLELSMSLEVFKAALAEASQPLSPVETNSIWMPVAGDCKYPVGAVRLHAAGAHRVSFSALGGGMVRSGTVEAFLRDFRRVEESEINEAVPHLAFFSLETSLDVAGFTYGDLWNGWAKPLIPVVAMREWVDAMKEELDGLFSFDGDKLLYRDALEETPVVVHPSTILADGKHYQVYNLNLGLCWDAVTVEELADAGPGPRDDVRRAIVFEGLDVEALLSALPKIEEEEPVTQ